MPRHSSADAQAVKAAIKKARAAYTESALVHTPAADQLQQQGWAVVWAAHETFGPQGTLGRGSEREVVLTAQLRAAIERLNPGLPAKAYDDALKAATAAAGSQQLLAINQEKYQLLRHGVPVEYNAPASPHKQKRHLRLIDFDNPANNDFLAVCEFTVMGAQPAQARGLGGLCQWAAAGVRGVQKPAREAR